MNNIIDATKSPRDRKRVEAIIKASNISKGSMFIKPTYSAYGYSYNMSMKGVRG